VSLNKPFHGNNHCSPGDNTPAFPIRYSPTLNAKLVGKFSLGKTKQGPAALQKQPWCFPVFIGPVLSHSVEFSRPKPDSQAQKYLLTFIVKICDSYTKQRTPAGLLWIGEEHYATPGEFLAEGAQLGFSRRIAKLPNGFKIGETWVFLAHRKAKPGLVEGKLFDKEPGFLPGIFLAIRPQRVERIVWQSEHDHFFETLKLHGSMNVMGESWLNLIDKSDEVFWRLKRDYDRGITLVAVPDGDPDHK
jgi:hypothetical protein